MHRARIAAAALFLLACTPGAQAEDRLDALIARMTLAEKAGQLTQYSGDLSEAAHFHSAQALEDAIAAGDVGAVLNVYGNGPTRRLQQAALRSRLKIPLLFGQDVIHGFGTVFPIPLAEAASWDLEAIESSARIAATEAAASGIHWTFAPMIDIARDPRWGRVMEGAGEDPLLGARIAAARVRGFQGRHLGDVDAVMACAKHFAGYGAATGGRDYDTVDLSGYALWNVTLPPFQAAVEAGAATVMTAFNDLNGVPATANRFLLRDVLRGAWGFRGFVVSDWNAVGELVPHGTAAGPRDAARRALEAGTDMDMESSAYLRQLPGLVREGRVPAAVLDEAVRRVLQAKEALGLFDDPFRFSDARREQAALADPGHRAAARALAARSIVLLRNEGGLLPLRPGVDTIAVIGPLAKATRENNGSWSVELPGVDYEQRNVSLWDGLQRGLRETRGQALPRLVYARGSAIDGEDRGGIAEAVEAARHAQLAILSVGERRDMSGESRSRSSLRLPGVQEDLVRAVAATGTPVVVLVSAGRPLVLDGILDRVPALVYTWWLGTEAGDAIADVLLGRVGPSGRLPITFPRSEGQIPIYYNHPATGRPPRSDTDHEFVTGYRDLPNSPRYPFGFGLTYTRFTYGPLALDATRLRAGGTLTARMVLANDGAVAGDEVVQLYLHQKVGELVRPVRALVDFRRVHLEAGERTELRFTVDRATVSYRDAQGVLRADPGEFELQVGASSEDIRGRAGFWLVE